MLATFRRVNDLARNDADALRATATQTLLDRLATEFLAFIDVFDDIAPEPVPHVHQPHQDTANRCRITAPAAFLASWAVAYHLSSVGGLSAISLAFWTLVAVSVADAVGQLAF